MLPRNPLFLLFTATLLALPNFNAPKPPPAGPAFELSQDSISFEPSQMSNDNKYSLRGTVVNSVTGEAVRGALVQIFFNGQSSMLTGPDGKFQFDGLPSGQSNITVRKPGFFPDQDFEPSERGQRMATTGPNSPPMVLKLVPEGVIYGRISEEDGEPLEGLPIALHVQSLQNGRRVWEQRSQAQTDEDGNFRIAELQPGNYFLSAGPSRTPLAFPARLPQTGAQGIPVVYYPAGTDLSAAAPIAVTPGKKIELNFTISPQPFYRISGTVSGYAPGQSVNVQLRNSAGIPLAYHSRVDSATGSFRILSVPAGAYTLQANASNEQGLSMIATMPLTVSAELSGLHVILLPTVNIPIQMNVISSRTDTEHFSTHGNYFPAYVQLVGHNGGMFDARYWSQQVGAPGALSLELQGVAPGMYGVEINPNGPYYVQNALSGTTNLLDSELSVAPGSSPQPIEITLRDDVATLSGTVSLDNKPLSATILAISEHSSILPRIQPTDSSGGFQLASLPPGAYKILALDHPDRLEYSNPDAMRNYLLKAREITLSPDQSARIDLELVKVGD